jgi:hypothetical protein
MADTSNTTLLNGVRFKYKYKVSNEIGEFEFNDSAVLSLLINDNIFSPFANGYITLTNPYNGIEGKFILRGDGTDKIEIMLQPEADEGKKLEFTFTIVREENLIDDSTQAKNRKTYFFEHQDEVLLREVFPYGRRYRGKVGDIIKTILQDEFKFDIDTGNWESGDFIIDSLPTHIIPSMSYRYLDIIYYLLHHYYYLDDGLPVKAFLRWSPSTKKYSLTPLSRTFASNDKNVYETFHSGELVTDQKSNPNNPTAGGEFKTYINNIVSINATVPGTSVTNAYFMNSLITSYDHILGSFNTAKVQIKALREKWTEKFISVFKLVGGTPKPYANLTDIKVASEFKLYRLPFSYRDSVNIATADTITNLTLFNQQLNFNVIGDTGRSSGVFTDIVKAKDDSSKGDQILLGRWYITIVRHMKLLNTYRNEIFCSKPYAGPDFKVVESKRTE